MIKKAERNKTYIKLKKKRIYIKNNGKLDKFQKVLK
jgi:hypothetical protein